MKVVNVHRIRENSIISLHLPVTMIQLLLAYGQFYFIYNCSPRPYSYQFDYFEVNARHDITLLLNISICISKRQGHSILKLFSQENISLISSNILSIFSFLLLFTTFKNWFILIRMLHIAFSVAIFPLFLLLK